MVIDWFTVGAQILNFLVLVWLLKRFLYRPVLDAIGAREKRIAATLADAAASKALAAKERDDLLAKNNAFDAERAALMAKAADEAHSEGKRLANLARKAADDLKEKQRKTLARDAKNLSAEISRRAKVEVFAIARKTLAEMADAKLEDRMTALFVKKLGALDAPAKAEISGMLGSSGEPVLVRSAFELTAKQAAAIRKAIDATFEGKIDLRFETVPDLVGGIELVAGGQKLAWSISDYLKTLEKSVDDLLTPDSVADRAA
jgi:F-type H+-transporting ATPase subunit b